jgi:predicted PurR-regulated permease PerM
LAYSKKITLAIAGEEKAQKAFRMLRFAHKTFGGFIQGKLINAVIIGFITWVIFAIFGIPYALLLSIIVMVTDLIPIFGPFIGAVPCAFIVLISNPEKLLLLLILTLIIQQVDGNIIAPRILGNSTGLPAIMVITAITIMGGIFGMVGMVIGVPVFAVFAKLLYEKTEEKIAKNSENADMEASEIATEEETESSSSESAESGSEVADQ